MKKSTKISLLVSLALVLAGALMIFISLLGVGFDMRNFSDMTFEKKVFDITDSFEVVHIIEETDDIELYPSDEKTCKIVCYDSDRTYHECFVDKKSDKLEKNHLRVLYRDERAWYEKIMPLFKGDRKVQIYLPEKAYNELAVSSVNSDISVPSDFTFDKANIHTVNGKIGLNANITKWVSVEATNGEINLSGEISGKIHADTVNGKITAKNIKSAETADFSTTNGNIELDGDTVVYLCAHSTNGSIKFGTTVSDRIDIETVNGSITGTVVPDKKCVGRSVNGNVSVPNKVDSNGDYYFKTVNGNIDIKEK